MNPINKRHSNITNFKKLIYSISLMSIFLFSSTTCNLTYAGAKAGRLFTSSPKGSTFSSNSMSWPLSGSEPPYEPDSWNNEDKIKLSTNCYAYAFNLKYDPITKKPFMKIRNKMPAFSNGKAKDDLSNLIELVIGDAKVIGKNFRQIGKYEKCKDGNYKVALFMFNYREHGELYSDFHFYRQNPDGTWSHKPGVSNVTDRDSIGNIITDPETAVKKFAPIPGVSYDKLLGFFEVGSN